MKKNINLKKIDIFALLSMIMFLLSAVLMLSFAGNYFLLKSKSICDSNKQTIFADYDEDITIDKNFHIENDETIFESDLWRAIKKFYNKAIDDKAIDDGVPVDEDDKVDDYFTIELFKNPNFTLTTLDLSNKSIDSIDNLKYMDLSMFDEVDLSGNSIVDIDDELINITNLTKLDLSKNKLKSFDCLNLNENCYSQTLVELNLSENELSKCNLKQIANSDCEIDIKLNLLTDSKLVLPQNENVKVSLSHNILDNINTENSNLSYGFQGVKDKGIYVVGKKIHFFGFGEYEQIEIYNLTAENEQEEEPTIIETLVKSLNINEENEYLFSIGYYRIKWTAEETDDDFLKDITIYVCPKAPIVKMFVNGEELEDIDYKLTQKATIKIVGDEGAKIYYNINNAGYVEGDEFEINKVGINYILITQVIDGYQSEVLTLYVNYNPPNTMGWIVYIGGIAIFGALFYLAIKYYPVLVHFHIGKNGKDGRKNLD